MKKREPYRPWTDEQSNTAIIMYYQGKKYREIADAVGHSPGSVLSHFLVIEYGKQPHKRRRKYKAIRLRPVSGEAPPAYVLAERDKRLSLSPVSIGAVLFGDPAPGRSALDRRA